VNGRSPIILVTGASGFAGSHLVEHLSERYDLTCWTRSTPPPDIANMARWAQVDMLDRGRVRQEILALRPTAVYHCAGSAHVAHSWRDTVLPLSSNVLTTHYLLDALRRASSPCRVVLPGSANVYAASTRPLREDSELGPASPYAVSKLAQEQLGRRALIEDGVDVMLMRAFNHIGPRQSPAFAVASWARQIARIEREDVDPVIRVGSLDTHRDLTDVRDTVRAYALLMERGEPGTIYNVASGVARPMRDVLDALVARSRVPVEIAMDPTLMRPNDIPVLVGDSTRLHEATGWAPRIGFDRTLDDLLDYWRTSVRA
jgi:GDP-4-dehydro-6-deoxy-D-mannose reductase